MLANSPSWLHGWTDHIQNEGSDLTEEAWFLAVTPYSLLHLHNPFFTNYVNYPYGANLVANTTMFLPGLLLAPVTFVWGPVATFNVLMVLCYAGSATSAFALFRRWAPWTPASFIGGLLYGFSPYMVAVGYGHLFLLFAVFPPLIVLILDVILMRQSGNPLAWGALLGVVATCQFLTSTEVLASSATITMAGLVLLVIFRRHEIRSRYRYAAVGLSSGLLIFALLCAYPIWMLTAGPQHLDGPPQPLNVLDLYSSDVLGLVAPTANQLISPASIQQVANRFTNGDLAENGTYMGVPLILLLIALVGRYRRSKIVQFAAAMACVSLVLSLGPRLRIDGRLTGIRLPFTVFRHLPLLDGAIASRYSLYVCLFSGMVLAIAIDRLHRDLSVRPGWNRRSMVACTVIAAVGLFPLIPNWPYPIAKVTVPTFFSSGAVRSIPPGSVLLTYPMAIPGSDDGMLWQAEDAFRYRIPAGYLLSPGPKDTTTASGPPATTETLFTEASSGQPQPTASNSLLCRVDDDLRVWHVSTIVVTTVVPGSHSVLMLVDSALGTRPRHDSGVYLYAHVQQSMVEAFTRLGCAPTSTLP